MKRFLASLVILGTLLCLANAQDSAPTPSSFNITTFNTALLDKPGWDLDAVRPVTYDAIEKFGTDVICLQELWDPRDQQKIIERLNVSYPYYVTATNLTALNDNQTTTACEEVYADDLISCAAQNCLLDSLGSDLTDEFVSCVKSECTEAYNQTFGFSSCYYCLSFTLLAEGLTDAFRTCTSASDRPWDPNFGLLLLSKRPLNNTEVVPMLGINRGVLYGEVSIGSPESPATVGISCTHLSTEILPFYVSPVDEDYGSFEAENLAQANWLVNFTANSTANFSILLGDFNAGPSYSNLTYEWPASYEVFVNDNWKEQWFTTMTTPDTACTWCSANTRVDGDDDENQAIDHVFFKGFEGWTNRTQRVADYLVNGESVSDHYGVLLHFDKA